MIREIGPILAMKVRKSISAALPIKIFGGSPTRVAMPPISDARISAMRKGTGLTLRLEATNNVTGATSTTMVTLSRNAEVTAVTKERITNMRKGSPFPNRTAWSAIHWKRPVSFRTLAIIIMAARRKITFQSTA